VVAAALAAAGCTPSGFDAQQANAEARECASLLERHVTGRRPPTRIVVDGATIDIGTDPDGFYSVLEEKRGPDDFPLTGGRAETAQRASYISDLCKAKDASTSSRSSSSSSASTTSTTTTTTSTTTTTTTLPEDTVGGG
jgi:hypothetical protein